MALTNRLISVLGLLVFGGALLLVVLAPAQFERAAKSFVAAEVRAQLDPVVESKAGRKLKQAYGEWKARRGEPAAGAEADPVEDVAAQLGRIVAGLCHYDCAERKQLESSIASGLRGTLSRLAEQREVFAARARAKYAEIVTKLRRDLMIFTGANAAIFAVLLLTSLLGPAVHRALMLPAALLTVSTLIATGMYLFGQNWFFTILTDSYLGYGYLAYIGVLFLFFLCVFYVRVGLPVPVESSAGPADCATGTVEAAAESVVGTAESIVGFFADVVSGLVPS